MKNVVVSIMFILMTIFILAQTFAIRQMNRNAKDMMMKHEELKSYVEQLCAEQRAMEIYLSNYFYYKEN